MIFLIKFDLFGYVVLFGYIGYVCTKIKEEQEPFLHHCMGDQGLGSRCTELSRCCVSLCGNGQGLEQSTRVPLVRDLYGPMDNFLIT